MLLFESKKLISYITVYRKNLAFVNKTEKIPKTLSKQNLKDFHTIKYYIKAVTQAASPKTIPGALAIATGKSRCSLNSP